MTHLANADADDAADRRARRSPPSTPPPPSCPGQRSICNSAATLRIGARLAPAARRLGAAGHPALRLVARPPAAPRRRLGPRAGDDPARRADRGAGRSRPATSVGYGSGLHRRARAADRRRRLRLRRRLSAPGAGRQRARHAGAGRRRAHPHRRPRLDGHDHGRPRRRCPTARVGSEATLWGRADDGAVLSIDEVAARGRHGRLRADVRARAAGAGAGRGRMNGRPDSRSDEPARPQRRRTPAAAAPPRLAARPPGASRLGFASQLDPARTSSACACRRARYGIAAIVMYALGLVVGARIWLVHFSQSVRRGARPARHARGPRTPAAFEQEKRDSRAPAANEARQLASTCADRPRRYVAEWFSLGEAAALLIVPALLFLLRRRACSSRGFVPVLLMDGVAGLLAEVAVQFVFGAADRAPHHAAEAARRRVHDDRRQDLADRPGARGLRASAPAGCCAAIDAAAPPPSATCSGVSDPRRSRRRRVRGRDQRRARPGRRRAERQQGVERGPPALRRRRLVAARGGQGAGSLALHDRRLSEEGVARHQGAAPSQPGAEPARRARAR